MNIGVIKISVMNAFLKCFSLTIVVLAAASCANNRTGSEERKDGRLEHSPYVETVDVITLQNDVFDMHILSNGKLTASSKAEVYFGRTGVISFLGVKNGQFVPKGYILAELDNEAAAISLESAQIAMDMAELNLKDALVGQGYSPKDTSVVPAEVLKMVKVRSGWSSAKNALRKAEYDMRAAVVRAPLSGRVANLAYGKYDSSGSSPLCQIVDDSCFNVLFSVLESEYPDVHIGQIVKVSPFSEDGEQVTGRIVSVNPVVDERGQISVTASVAKVPGFIDGMNVRVLVEKELGRALTVPKSAVVIRDGHEVVFRYKDGHAEWVYINTLYSNSSSYAVQADPEKYAELSVGDQIIVSGNINLADGSEVKLRNQQ